MPGSNKLKRVWQNWKGNYTFAAWQNRHNPTNSEKWYGLNCQVYSDGSVGPAPSAIAFTFRDRTNNDQAYPAWDVGASSDKMLGMVVYENPGAVATGDFCLAIFDDSNQKGVNWFYDWTVPTTSDKFSTSVTLSFPNPGEQPRTWKHPNSVFPESPYAATISLDGRDIFVGGQDKFDGTGNTAITVTPASASAYSCVHKDRLYTSPGVMGSNPMRVAYSDPADYTTFTSASQFFDLADSDSGDAVGGMYSLGNQLLIYTIYGNWYVLNGDAETGSVRKLGPGPIPSFHGAAVVFKNRVMFLGGPHLGIVIVSAAGIDTESMLEINPFRSLSDGPLFGGSTLSSYQGAVTYGYEIGPAVVDEQYGYMGFYLECPNPRDPWSGNPVILEFINGEWGLNQYDVQKPSAAASIDQTKVLAACAGMGRVFTLVPGVIGTTDYYFVVDRVIAADSPVQHHLISSANVDTYIGLSGTAGQAKLRINPIAAIDDNEVRPIAVTVSGKYWCASTTNATFPDSAGLAVLAYEDEDSFFATGTDLSGSAGALEFQTTANRQPYTRTFKFDTEEFRDQFMIEFTLTSCSVDKVVVEYEQRPKRY